MSEKVKVTMEQAQEIDKISDVDYAINIHGLNKRPDSPLATLKTADIARALFVGYEVEPEFKVGDWVVVTFELHITIYGKTKRITDVKKSHAAGHDLCFDLDGQGIVFSNEIRHATPSEIAAEKERRTDEKLDRIIQDLSTEERDQLYNKLMMMDVSE